ncbi:MAG TPA: class I SAM-dependent methyltransferase [Gaiellaceae bacterium]
MSTHDSTRARFAATAERLAELQGRRADELAARVAAFVPLEGDERALDAGTGAGALALALTPLVREVVGVDLVPELLEQARARAPANVSFVEGDVTRLQFDRASFDLAGTLRTLHHIARPELVLAELVRVTRPGGLVLVVDQIAPNDPLAALELNRFERARDPSHTRALADVDLRQLFESNGLVLRSAEFVPDPRELDPYLDLAACEGEARERARALAPPDYTAVLGWYLLYRP